MLKACAFVCLVLMLVAFAACEKDAPYDKQTQLEIDDAIIAKYLLDSNVKATKHASGLYYSISKEGAGNAITETDTVFGNYSMKILKDSAILSKSLDNTFRFLLPGYIEGWKIGVSLIKPGGMIRLIVPSPLGFQQRAVTNPKIPPNSILDIILQIDTVITRKTND